MYKRQVNNYTKTSVEHLAATFATMFHQQQAYQHVDELLGCEYNGTPRGAFPPFFRKYAEFWTVGVLHNICCYSVVRVIRGCLSVTKPISLHLFCDRGLYDAAAIAISCMVEIITPNVVIVNFC